MVEEAVTGRAGRLIDISCRPHQRPAAPLPAQQTTSSHHELGSVLTARKCNKTNNAIVIRNVALGTISIAATRGRCQIATAEAAELISADSGALLRSEACSFAASRSLTRESRDVAPLTERDATKQVNIACAVIARHVSRLREIAEPLRYF
ncbi:unnamed protein product [Plutella xylostella]|uniref:(diamondback moth) hypothetical protein n=1 Tax=Plutella xylostella TaxID=51655 RepID=A0A8S4G8Y9_PLUXY|nr:unnamed protein product [Plutella xylostella]